MIKQLKLPTVLWDNNGSFTDYSVSAASYGRDTCSLASLSATEDYFYFGMYKPFYSVYVETATNNDNTIVLDLEYYNGTSWTNILKSVDETLGFNRSGFIRWEIGQTNWAVTTINSVSDKYWIRFRPGSNFDADASIYGINIVYSDDQDLIQEVPEILSWLPASTSTYVLRHQASRDDIIQAIRNSGKYKQNYSEGLYRNIDAWDFLDIDEIRQWSKYLTLSKIFENLSTVKDDVWWARSEMFKKKADQAANLYYMSLDTNDDGTMDVEERLGTNFRSVSIIKTG